jgi:phage terminase large subunit
MDADMPDEKVISLKTVVGGGYSDFWNFRGRYRVCKGSRASKKSKTTALNIIVRMVQHPQANTLVVRKVFCTLRDSCFSDLKWAIRRLGLDAYWQAKESPLELVYKPTGQKILFRGLDDPIKITSIAVEQGALCWVWLEEAYELLRESEFHMLDEAVRGAVPDGLFKQITLIFNPWNARHWLRDRFFGKITGLDADGKPVRAYYDNWVSEDGQIMAKTTTYECNEWLDAADRAMFEAMRTNNPRRFQVAGLGHWGIVDGVVYENWEEQTFDREAVSARPGVRSAFGLDFGYTNDPSALFCGLVDVPGRVVWVFDELYQTALTNSALAAAITAMGYAKERIKADSAEPKSIDELRELGLTRVRGAKKGKDSVNNGIQFIQGFKIIVHPRCVNFITEISNYFWSEDKFGHKTNAPADEFNHLMDAMRYALEEFIMGSAYSFQ